MSFTSKSEKLIKYFVKDFDNYCEKKSKATQNRTDTILKMIYQDIKLSDGFVNILNSRNLINFDIREIKSLRELPKTELMDSNFVGETIREKIYNTILGYMNLEVSISNVTVKIYIGIFKKSDFNKLNKLKSKLIEALKMIKFCLNYSRVSTIRSLNIYLYLTDEDKMLPDNHFEKIGPKHCNSAVTFACAKDGKVLVYREEEWKKVLLHELFHALCLDFSGMKYDKLRRDVKSVFKVESDFEISESYSEFWGTVLNCCFISYKLLDNDNVEEYLLYVEFCLQLERIFSLFQMVKILHFMGLKYKNLYADNGISKTFRNVLYKEKTNVLCYYVIKTILLLNSDDFLRWCLIYNNMILKFDKSDYNLNSFFLFFKQKYNNNYFLKMVKKMELFFQRFKYIYSKRNRDLILQTTRMTICEN